jgi:glutaconate CoA-transferase, subunit A
VPSKLVDLETAVSAVPDGAALGVGGVLLQRKPVGLLAALARAGRRDLHVSTFLGSVDVELLAACGALASVDGGYVGFEQLGFAPAFGSAVDAGAVTWREHTEVLYVTALRAAGAGLPFLPAKGGTGSEVTQRLGYQTITCPYTGMPVLAVPAARLDIAVLHVEAAGEDGTLLGPQDPDFLHDFDAVLARAADRVIATAEEILPDDQVVAARRRTLLFGFEVEAVVHLPRGAAPGGMPGRYAADLGRLRAYLDAVRGDPDAAQDAALALGAAVTA